MITGDGGAAGQLHRYRPGVGDEVFHTAGAAVGAAAPRSGGGYLLAAADGFRLVGATAGPKAARCARPGWWPMPGSTTAPATRPAGSGLAR